MHNYTIWFNVDLKKVYQLQDGSRQANSPKEALEQYLTDFHIISINKVGSRDNANVSVKFSDGRYNFYSIVIEKVVKDSEKEPDMKTVIFNGKQYVCKRYSSEELYKTFCGYAVALKDTKTKDMNLVSGILVDVFDSDKRNLMREKYMIEGLDYSVWDLSPQPILVGFNGVMQ